MRGLGGERPSGLENVSQMTATMLDSQVRVQDAPEIGTGLGDAGGNSLMLTT